MHCTKMQGLGNDYLYFYGLPENPSEVSKKLSDRHFGVGSDGMITIEPSKIADFKMRIFNADGSEAKMCGNGIRCVGKYVYDKGYTDKKHLKIETLSGIKTLDLAADCCGVIRSASVDMGKVTVCDPVTLSVCGENVTCTPVDVGNPHAVVFVNDAEKAPLYTLGAAMEKHEYFKDGVNVEFVSVTGANSLRMRVWERGSGVTMACGTGACAAAAAACAAGYCEKDIPITVTLDGGDLSINVKDDGSVIMTGPAKTVCEIEVLL